MTAQVPGQLDWRALAATAHRPADAVTLAEAARRLAAHGLRPRDIAGPLGLSEAAVLLQLTEGAR